MQIRVLGSAAGGGLPQWNCGCPNCELVRRGTDRTEARTQDSIAVSGDRPEVVLVNTSPDLLAQIARTKELWPRAPRHSPIRAIVVTNGDMDHVLGLFSLRESYPLTLYATASVYRGLTENNVLFRTLQRFEGHLTWKELTLDRAHDLGDGLVMTPFAVPGKLPVHLMSSRAVCAEDNIGLAFESRGRRAVYCAAAGALGPYASRLESADVVLFDGTFWSADELVRLGLSTARAEDMAHIPVQDTLGAFATAKRRVYTHINNSNPILVRGTDERALVDAAGWEVAYDGMEIVP
jgi:pyrroloquinoline quinone biosynthesis protein B